MSNSGNFIQKGLAQFKHFPITVQSEIDKNLAYRKAILSSFVGRCETPIEQLLAVHLIDVEDHLLKEFSILKEFNSINIIPQKEVVANKRKYRLDFLITCNTDSKKYDFAIECDGHDFHEKTKEQSARDKARERNLMKEGYTVIRFAGSEIYKNAIRCTGEIISIVQKEVGLDDYYEELIKKDKGVPKE